MIKMKRVYDPAAPEDGERYLVDRLWPRGIKREKLIISEWLKEIAPSDSLRRWYHHDPTLWEEFYRRYAAELDEKPEIWRPLAEKARSNTITLLFSSRNLQNNNAVALSLYLKKHLAADQGTAKS